MKVLMVITSLGVGGAEKVVTSLADQLVNLGHEVIIVYLTGEALITPKQDSIQLVNLNISSARGLIAGSKKLRKLIKDFKPDVVHSHLVHANILCRVLRPTTTIPRLITSAHNTNEEGRSRIIAYRLTDRFTDISTNVSEEAVQAFIDQHAVRSGRMLTLHNSISTIEFNYSDKNRTKVRDELDVVHTDQLIVSVGRLNEQKDYPNLLSAIKVLSKKHQNITLAIAGDGPHLQALQKQTINLGINNKVRLLGIRTDIPSLMSAADVFVLSSAWEGFGLVVAEAMACERVVVATDCGGVREVVGDAGFLVPPRDSLKLANALEKALELDSKERLQLGKEARNRILEHYSLAAATEKWLHLYSAPIADLKTSFITSTQR
ncbi:glycosyltransferase [Psychrobacter submarinus]|uniref:glycosyltransferase n=1 Tax=Psychrobacter submarinus TaxID=154108 RepID=UPI001919E603|nr:glycosyltransferase [Psychrobacter submarinus]